MHKVKTKVNPIVGSMDCNDALKELSVLMSCSGWEMFKRAMEGLAQNEEKRIQGFVSDVRREGVVILSKDEVNDINNVAYAKASAYREGIKLVDAAYEQCKQSSMKGESV